MRSGHVGLLMWAALLLAACGGSPSEEPVQAAVEKEPPAVRVARAELRKAPKVLSATGSLEADETATVSNEVAGKLAVIHVDFGDPVRKGQVLAELDKRELELQLERARSALAQALARLGLTPDQVDVVPETTPAIRQAEAQLETARTKYESAAKLVKTGDIAHDRYVEIEKAYHSAQAAVDAARREMQAVLAQVRSLRAEVALAEKRLADAAIRAPFDGFVAERLASPGEYLRPNTPVLRLVKPYPLRLRFDVPESAAAGVRPGRPLRFRTDALPGEEFIAKVTEVAAALNPRSRTLRAEARVGRRDPRLKPGMFVQVQLVVDPDAAAVVVPRRAVRTVAGLRKVFVIEDGRAVERKIETGREFGDWVEVRNGAVSDGMLLALDHLDELVDGMPVTVIDAGS